MPEHVARDVDDVDAPQLRAVGQRLGRVADAVANDQRALDARMNRERQIDEQLHVAARRRSRSSTSSRRWWRADRAAAAPCARWTTWTMVAVSPSRTSICESSLADPARRGRLDVCAASPEGEEAHRAGEQQQRRRSATAAPISESHASTSPRSAVEREQHEQRELHAAMRQQHEACDQRPESGAHRVGEAEAPGRGDRTPTCLRRPRADSANSARKRTTSAPRAAQRSRRSERLRVRRESAPCRKHG